jgi:hypothetical protein
MGYAQVTFSRKVVKSLIGRIEDLPKWADLPADAEVVDVCYYTTPLIDPFGMIGARVLLKSDEFEAETPEEALRDAGISLTTSTWSFPMPSGFLGQRILDPAEQSGREILHRLWLASQLCQIGWGRRAAGVLLRRSRVRSASMTGRRVHAQNQGQTVLRPACRVAECFGPWKSFS